MTTENPTKTRQRLFSRLEGMRHEASTAVADSRIAGWWRATSRPSPVEWALLSSLLLLCFVTFLYGDIRATFEHSFNFLDSLFSGKVGDFYEIAIQNTSTGHPAVYDISLYLLFGVWNLPTYLFYKFADYDYLYSTPALLWLKLMMVVFAAIAARLLMGIARTLGMDANRAKWVAFFFLSSMSLIIPAFVIVQYDIVLVVFMLAGIHAYMKGDYRGFLLWFMAGNTLKLFAVFVFVPLVLLKEKRLLHAFGHMAVGALGIVVCRLPYRGNTAYEASTGGFKDEMLSRLTSTGFQWSYPGYTIGVFVVFMVGLVVFCYAKRVSTAKELRAFAVYVPLSVYLVFCALVPLNHYWVVLLAPFAALVVFMNPRDLKLNMLLEVGFVASLLFVYNMPEFKLYNNNMFDGLPFGNVVSASHPARFRSIGDILTATGLDKYVLLAIAFMTACTLAILILNYPGRRFVSGMPNRQRVERGVVWLRLAAPLCFVVLLFSMYLAKDAVSQYTTLTSAPQRSHVDILAKGTKVEQELVFDKTIDTRNISIGFYADHITWIDSAIVHVTVLDSKGDAVFSHSAPANMIGNNLTFSTDGLVLRAHEAYTLRIDGEYGEGEPAYVQMNPAVDNFVTQENGQTVSGDVAMSIAGEAR